MAFTTIHLPSDIPPAHRARARASGPRAVGSRGAHDAMLRRADFDVDVERDVTSEFLATARAWLRESEALADELASLQPAGEFEERQQDRRQMIAAIEDGLLRRTMFVATRRGRRLPG
jgi:hypothetical protein